MQGRTGLIDSPGLPLLRISKSLILVGHAPSNGINVLQVTGKCQGSPGTAYGCTGEGACARGAQAKLSYPARMPS